MSVRDELTAELQDAMRSGDRPRVNVIRQVRSEVSVASAAPGFSGEVDDALYLATIGSYVKKLAKAKREYEDVGERGREHVEKLGFEIEYLSRWLPVTLDEDETRALVRSAIEELGATDPKSVGRVIGHVMKSDFTVDGGLVSRLVREELGA
jgi:uncharacterized protein YqeY